MFTGLVERTGTIIAADRAGDVHSLRIDTGWSDLAASDIGGSFAVDGVCLTLVAFEGPRATFDLVTSTLEKTTLAGRGVGDLVNLERSARIGQRNGGHEVSGHVDCVARVDGLTDFGHSWRVRFQLPAGRARYLVNQGFVAINGCSLTVYDVDPVTDRFDVWLIPETLRQSNLHALQAGSGVNIEFHQVMKLITDNIYDAVRQHAAGGVDAAATAAAISRAVHESLVMSGAASELVMQSTWQG